MMTAVKRTDDTSATLLRRLQQQWAALSGDCKAGKEEQNYITAVPLLFLVTLDKNSPFLTQANSHNVWRTHARSRPSRPVKYAVIFVIDGTNQQDQEHVSVHR